MITSETMAGGHIKPVKFGCGCTYHPEPDVNGIAPWLKHCRLHAAAPDLLAACQSVAGVYAGQDDAPLFAQKAQRAIAKAGK